MYTDPDVMDEEIILDLTFWEYLDVRRSISADDASITVISIENAPVNLFKNSVTLNVGNSSSVKINFNVKAPTRLSTMSNGDASYNLSLIHI